MSLAANHTDMTKFDNRSNSGYMILVDFVRTGAGAGMRNIYNDAGMKPYNTDSPSIQSVSKSSTESHDPGQSDLVGKLTCFVV